MSARFADVRRLGAGAEGGTWLAKDGSGRQVVLKHVPADRRAVVARAFEVLREVSSPHLPAALELIAEGAGLEGEARGGVWLVTGFVEGESLGAGPVPLEQALSEALGVAHALAAIHGLGTHHGDVSANNVIVTPTRGVVLTDLGQLGSFGCGTPGFLAPEVLGGGGGPAADRFGVGSLLCLRLFGQVAWRRPERVLELREAADVRRRLRALAEAAQVELPGPVEALLERLLDPDPNQRVADPQLLVARLRQLHRASLAGELPRAHSAWWLPNRWRFVGEREPLERAAAAIQAGSCRLVAVVGPVGSGRGRWIEELVGRLQLARTRAGAGSLAARLSDPDTLALDLLDAHDDPAAGGANDWITAWVGEGREGEGGGTRSPATRVWGSSEAPAWPARLVDRPQLQAAVLRAGAGLSDQVLLLPVEPELGELLGRAMEADGSAPPGVEVVFLDRWDPASVAACLGAVVEDDGTPAHEERVDRWAAALHGATGGWPAKVVRAIEACARTGADDPDRAAVERALVAADSEPRLDPETARRVLDRRWGLEVELPATLLAAGEPLGSAVAAARLGLGEALVSMARATLEQARAEGRAIPLALALDADDADAVETCELPVTADLPSDLIDWLERGGAVRVGPRLRLRVLRELIRRGEAERALSLLEAIAATGSPSPAEGLEGVRALEQIGRPREAITSVDELLPRTAGPDRDRAYGLRWRALVDAGEAALAREQAEAWAAEQAEGDAAADPSWRRAVAWLWGALARLYTGGDPAPWLDRALDECAGEHGPSTARIVAGLRARVFQLEANLAQFAGEGERARERYRAAAESFAAAGEGLGRVLVEGSLAGMAFEAGELAEACERGRRAVRGFLARAQVQTLPAALFNLLRALVAIGALDEGRRLHALVSRMVEAAGSPSQLSRGRLRRAAIELDAGAPPQPADARDPWRRALARRLTDCAAELAQAGAVGEGAEAHVLAALHLRVADRPAAARGELEAARALVDGGEEQELDQALALGLAIEALAQAVDPSALAEASAALAELPSPSELWREGQRQLAWTYDRALLGALHRHGQVGDATSVSVARRMLRHLETFMAKAPPLDRRALRQSLLSEAGEAAPLRELVRELAVAEQAEAEAEADDTEVEAEGAGAETPAARADPPAVADPGAAESSPPARAPGPPARAPGSGSRRERGSESDRLHQLLRIFRRLAREDQLERLLEQVVEAMMELTDAERGVVCVGKGEERIEVAREFAWESEGEPEGAAGEAVSFSRSVIDRVLGTGEPVLSVDAASDDRFDGSRSISHLNLRSVLAVPLVFRGELLGAAYVDHRLRRGNFDATDLAYMEDFGDLAALAVAQARALAEVREQAATLEAQRAELAELLASREVEVVNLREAVRAAPARSMYRGMVGQSKAMQQVFRLVDRLADSEVPVVIYGESGTGKELVARAIHDAGPRGETDKPFVAENCGAIPETLLESVLFGHVRGAFTGAQAARPGLFEAADGGTIFLDEIGETSPAMQTKLLRVLQEGEVRRLGETRSRKVDVRVIAASNRDLEAMVEAGEFRQDLYYRINVVKLELPPLRDRREDIPALVDHFLRRHSRGSEGKGEESEPAMEVSASALRKLTRYPWPGNVRELENEVQRWLALCEDRVMPDDLSPAIEGSQVEVDDPDDLELRPRVERLERELIGRAMERTGGNQTQAAQLLGLSRYGLQKKLKRMEEDG